jgi:hypothetical protein
MLSSYLDVPAGALQFSAGESGKPRLAGAPGLEFSFARTDGLALLAVARDREVGVDVERENARTDIDLVAREFLPAGAAGALECTPPDRRRSAFFSAGAHVVVRPLALRPGFAGAVAAADSGWTVRAREFPPAACSSPPSPTATSDRSVRTARTRRGGALAGGGTGCSPTPAP